MTRLLPFALCTLLWAAALHAQDKSYTWIAAPSRGQLERDPSLIPQGKGFLFVPTMTNALNEPSYRVFQGNDEIAEANTSTGIMLAPGFYEVYIGSGSIAQMMSRTVEVREGMTTLVKPFWSGLVINVIDPNRTSINESYELYWQDQQENYGIGFGIEEERGEAVKTWLLPPGVYTVLNVGDNISTTRKFSVRLEPGELVQRNLVVDTTNLNFIGFYPPTLQGLLSQGRSSNWKTSWQLSGSTQFTTSQNTTGEDLSVFSLSTQVFGRATYNSDKAFANLRLIFEEGFTREEGDAFRKSIDDFDLRGTYIYRGFSERFGPYLRGELSTKFFATEARFDQQQRLYQIDANGDTTRVLSSVNGFTLSPALSPLEFRQGLGINSQLVRSFQLNLAMRIGLGARQTYAFDTFDLSQDRTSARQIKSATSTGLEALLVLDSRLSNFISLDSEFDLLIPEVNNKSWEFTWENRWRINLSRFINLDLVVDFQRQKPLNRLQSEQQALLRFVYLL
jgi:hypothetical protein